MSPETQKKETGTAAGTRFIAQKALSGSVINTGTGEIVITAGGVPFAHPKGEMDAKETVNGDSIKQVVVDEESPSLLSIDQAFDRIGTAIRLNNNNLEPHIQKAIRESGDFIKLALIFAFLGFIILLFGVGLFVSDSVIEGNIAVVNAVVAGITAAFFYHKSQELRLTIEQYRQTITDSQLLLAKFGVADLVKEKKERENLKKELIRNALGIKPSSHPSPAPTNGEMAGRMQ